MAAKIVMTFQDEYPGLVTFYLLVIICRRQAAKTAADNDKIVTLTRIMTVKRCAIAYLPKSCADAVPGSNDAPIAIPTPFRKSRRLIALSMPNCRSVRFMLSFGFMRLDEYRDRIH